MFQECLASSSTSNEHGEFSYAMVDLQYPSNGILLLLIVVMVLTYSGRVQKYLKNLQLASPILDVIGKYLKKMIGPTC